MTNLKQFRETFARVILALIWANAALVAVFSTVFAAKIDVITLTTGCALAIGATYVWHLHGVELLTRVTTAIVLPAEMTLLVFKVAGTETYIDMHSCFLVALAVTAGWSDWRAIVASAGVVLLHLLAPNFTFIFTPPFAESYDYLRVALKAAALLFEAGALSWITMEIEAELRTAEVALAASDTERQETEIALEQAAAAITGAERVIAEQKAVNADQIRRMDLQAKLSDYRIRVEQARLAAERQKREEIQAKVVEFQKRVDELTSDLSRDAEALDQMAEQLAKVAERTQANAADVASKSIKTSRTVRDVFEESERVSVSIAEMVSVARNVRNVVKDTKGAADVTNDQIRMLTQETEGIREIVFTVQNIAAQTNLIALNATMEASRAGEAGKSFTYVAGEVQKLAEQARKATEEIEKRISGVTGATRTAAENIRDVSHRIEGISGCTGEMASNIERQRSRAADMVRHIHGVASGLELLAAVSQDTDEAAQYARTAVGHIAEAQTKIQVAAKRLSDCMGQFATSVAA